MEKCDPVCAARAVRGPGCEASERRFGINGPTTAREPPRLPPYRRVPWTCSSCARDVIGRWLRCLAATPPTRPFGSPESVGPRANKHRHTTCGHNGRVLFLVANHRTLSIGVRGKTMAARVEQRRTTLAFSECVTLAASSLPSAATDSNSSSSSSGDAGSCGGSEGGGGGGD